MSLTLDPELQRDYDEPPYSTKQPLLYAPAEPFAAAIQTWLRYQARLAGGALAAGGKSNGAGQCTIAGAAVLADMAHVPVRSLWAWCNGDRKHIEQGCADRLAIALDIPLPLLADEFRPLQAWKKP
jgi:hypothetical protein